MRGLPGSCLPSSIDAVNFSESLARIDPSAEIRPSVYNANKNADAVGYATFNEKFSRDKPDGFGQAKAMLPCTPLLLRDPSERQVTPELFVVLIDSFFTVK